ncbi:methionyl-tRNA formyltransferase [bacterium]|nr:methionyl-tRNA formyltransferase [bacterium]
MKTNEKLKIIFVGMPDMALVCLGVLLQNEFDIVGVVPPKKSHETYNYFKQYVEAKKLNIIDYEKSCNEEVCIKKIKELNADIGVVCSFNYLLSKEFLSSTKMGYINCHPSKLPQYRGAAPYFHIVKNGEKHSGITLHFMDETFDTGDIACQKEFEIMPNETMGTLFNRTNFMLSEALVEVLRKIEKEGKIDRFSQPKEGVFEEAPRVDGNFRIRWNINSVFEIERLIRACNPFYNAFTFFRGVNLKVICAKAIQKEHNYRFGELVNADVNQLLVAGKGGYLSLETFQLGTWGVYNPNDFYLTFSPKKGEFLI